MNTTVKHADATTATHLIFRVARREVAFVTAESIGDLADYVASFWPNEDMLIMEAGMRYPVNATNDTWKTRLRDYAAAKLTAAGTLLRLREVV